MGLATVIIRAGEQAPPTPLVLVGSISDYYILYWMNIGSNAEL